MFIALFSVFSHSLTIDEKLQILKFCPRFQRTGQTKNRTGGALCAWASEYCSAVQWPSASEAQIHRRGPILKSRSCWATVECDSRQFWTVPTTDKGNLCTSNCPFTTTAAKLSEELRWKYRYWISPFFWRGGEGVQVISIPFSLKQKADARAPRRAMWFTLLHFMSSMFHWWESISATGYCSPNEQTSAFTWSECSGCKATYMRLWMGKAALVLSHYSLGSFLL
jgi:hypothetical protein